MPLFSQWKLDLSPLLRRMGRSWRDKRYFEVKAGRSRITQICTSFLNSLTICRLIPTQGLPPSWWITRLSWRPCLLLARIHSQLSARLYYVNPRPPPASIIGAQASAAFAASSMYLPVSRGESVILLHEYHRYKSFVLILGWPGEYLARFCVQWVIIRVRRMNSVHFCSNAE